MARRRRRRSRRSPAALIERLALWFDTGTRAKGFDDQREDRVSFAVWNDRQIVAFVRGTNDYDVTLTPVRHVLHTSCTCHHAISGPPCRHVWATILEANESGELRHCGKVEVVRGVSPLHAAALATVAKKDLGTLLPESFDDFEDDDEFDPFDDLDDDDLDGDDGDDLLSGPWSSGAIPASPKRTTGRGSAAPSVRGARTASPAEWEATFRRIDDVLSPGGVASFRPAPGRRLTYVLSGIVAPFGSRPKLAVRSAARKVSGDWGVSRDVTLEAARARSGDPRDTGILEGLEAAARSSQHQAGASYRWYPDPMRSKDLGLSWKDLRPLVPALAGTGRLFVETADASELRPVTLEAAPLYRARLRFGRTDDGTQFQVTIVMTADGVPVDLRPELAFLPGFALEGGRLFPFEVDRRTEAWIEELVARGGRLVVSAKDAPRFVREAAIRGVELEVPEDLAFRDVHVPPLFAVRFARPSASEGTVATLLADYDGRRFPVDPRADFAVVDETRERFPRNPDAEMHAIGRLGDIGFTAESGFAEFRVPPKLVRDAIARVLALGFSAEGETGAFRHSTGTRVRVSSGIDWFDLEGSVDYGEGSSATLAEVLSAFRRGEKYVALGDGSFGLLPEEWLRRSGFALSMGKETGGAVRYTAAQAALVAHLVEDDPAAEVDERFAGAREALLLFDGVRPERPPKSFRGVLRPYQQQGLGWLLFLRDFGFGGCLADDMGLGKTVQTLALMATVRSRKGAKKPWLLVAPRSLVFNWIREAAKFTPEITVLDHTGAERHGREIERADIVVTTYGTLRRDVEQLRKIRFDCVVLDEAQMIKNAESQSALAARLLSADHRLALTGTPIENRLEELWSLFEFLNPGMLGRSSALATVRDGADRDRLAAMLRPFLLRRTKQQVAPELPERTEETLVCELSPPQRRFYDDLRRYWRESLGLGKRSGSDRAKVGAEVLTALLRLRQAACDPRLIAEKTRVPSAKLDALLPLLSEVVAEKHKAVVFSQFTSLLDLVEPRLDEAGLAHVRIDGSTTRREAVVDDFQNRDGALVLLASLKAGGVGLNLTAAEYVFLLDPWWNPAAEAQAIDRTHRIGQTKNVFAYRLVAKDTVEERILELQARKKELVASILGGGDAALKDLTVEELDRLLS